MVYVRVLTLTLACYAPAMWPCAIPSTARRAELQRTHAADMCDVLLASRVGSSPKHMSISFTAACSLAEKGVKNAKEARRRCTVNRWTVVKLHSFSQAPLGTDAAYSACNGRIHIQRCALLKYRTQKRPRPHSRRTVGAAPEHTPRLSALGFLLCIRAPPERLLVDFVGCRHYYKFPRNELEPAHHII